MTLFGFGAVLAMCSIASAQKAMDIHSFDRDIDFSVYQSRWFNAGTSIPLERHIVLSPSVADRFGAQWHKYPLLTNDFEVTFKVISHAPASGSPPPNDQGFAFWYVYENVTSVFPSEFSENISDLHARMSAHGWGLFGYRNAFKGLGLFFSNTRKTQTENGSPTELKPSVSLLLNDGTRSVMLPQDIPSSFGSYWNYRNTNLIVKLRVQSNHIKVEAKVEGNPNWVQLAEMTSIPYPIQSGGYIGFTGYIGADRSSKSSFGDHDSVDIENLVFINMDKNQKGEDFVPVVPADNKEHKEEFLHDKSEHGMERAEGKAIKTLSRMIFKMISETEPLKKSIASAIGTLSKRLTTMEKSVLRLKEEIVSLSGHDMDADYARMKAELAQLSSQALSDVALKKQHFESLKNEIESSMDSKNDHKRSASSQAVKTLHEVDIKARELKNQVLSRGSFTLYVALFCLVLVVLAGFALQRKLRNWEKKHLL